MTDKPRQPGDPHPLLEEHRRVHAIGRQLEQAETPTMMGERIREFHEVVQRHFAREEADGGFYDHLLGSAPRFQALLDELRAEHAMLLARLDELARRAAECKNEAFAELKADATAVAAALEQHETRENELLLDAMNTDLGTGD